MTITLTPGIPVCSLEQVFGLHVLDGTITLRAPLGQRGNGTIEDLVKIAMIARFLAPETVFEIGTFNGLTTLHLALNAPANVYTLDLPPFTSVPTPLNPTSAQLDDLSMARREGVYASVQTGERFLSVDGRISEPRITQLLGDSQKFDFRPYQGVCDLVFIDGCHEYDAVAHDSMEAWGMLRPGGTLLWHNYADPAYPGVTRVVNAWMTKWGPMRRISHLRGTSLAVTRKVDAET